MAKLVIGKRIRRMGSQHQVIFYKIVKVMAMQNPSAFSFSDCYTWFDTARRAESEQTGWPINKCAIRNLNISITARGNELILLSMIEACSSYIFMITCLERPFVKYQYWLHQIRFPFSRVAQKSRIRKQFEYLLYFLPKLDNFFYLIEKRIKFLLSTPKFINTTRRYRIRLQYKM
jgi:hypothetical protein